MIFAWNLPASFHWLKPEVDRMQSATSSNSWSLKGDADDFTLYCYSSQTTRCFAERTRIVIRVLEAESAGKHCETLASHRSWNDFQTFLSVL